MDYKDIEQLLERYWQCETSVEEEATLRDFFAKEEVPAHLLRYKNLFVYQQVQQEVGLGEDFDTRILAEVERYRTIDDKPDNGYLSDHAPVMAILKL